MSQSKKQFQSMPVDRSESLVGASAGDPEVVAFRQQFTERSPLDELIQEGARRMLQAAIDAEVETFIQQHQDRRDDQGRRLVVKNGKLPTRTILTGAGPLELQQVGRP